ncbi:hypothetical protein WHR41_04772 [Cladosporium halotolerans]|uniref:Uncharacterized protein n=1 Tax=Cladosporium halotolerans TaxID=1052096 RepID=A0AB34KLV3_9PEZI
MRRSCCTAWFVAIRGNPTTRITEHLRVSLTRARIQHVTFGKARTIFQAIRDGAHAFKEGGRLFKLGQIIENFGYVLSGETLAACHHEEMARLEYESRDMSREYKVTYELVTGRVSTPPPRLPETRILRMVRQAQEARRAEHDRP